MTLAIDTHSEVGRIQSERILLAARRFLPALHRNLACDVNPMRNIFCDEFKSFGWCQRHPRSLNRQAIQGKRGFKIERMELPAKLLDYFLRSNKSIVNQCTKNTTSVAGRPCSPWKFPVSAGRSYWDPPHADPWRDAEDGIQGPCIKLMSLAKTFDPGPVPIPHLHAVDTKVVVQDLEDLVHTFSPSADSRTASEKPIFCNAANKRTLGRPKKN